MFVCTCVATQQYYIFANPFVTIIFNTVNLYWNFTFFPLSLSPLNMLDSYENRFGYSFAFGLTAYSCVLVVLQSYDSILGSKAAAKVNKWPGYLSGMRIIIRSGLIYAVKSLQWFLWKRADVRNLRNQSISA